jgi:hypothetical protein
MVEFGACALKRHKPSRECFENAVAVRQQRHCKLCPWPVPRHAELLVAIEHDRTGAWAARASRLREGPGAAPWS